MVNSGMVSGLTKKARQGKARLIRLQDVLVEGEVPVTVE